jgi:hypothetical protein
MTTPDCGGSARARLQPGRVAHLADQQRLRTGIWFDSAGRICQHCPACAAVIAIPEPTDYRDDTDFAAYAPAVDQRLDQAVFEHLLLDLCPAPERAT